ncbi:olfactory receptor 13C9-like [Mixophyes fleayi]|uniref:olfactory receptor 13C9-like n=1 Tax=Mixophyes fleayi TaxID=3061075 RepID=UPI003F4DCAA9
MREGLVEVARGEDGYGKGAGRHSERQEWERHGSSGRRREMELSLGMDDGAEKDIKQQKGECSTMAKSKSRSEMLNYRRTEKLMDNQTSFANFYITAFSIYAGGQPYCFMFFLTLYLIGVLGNFVIIKVIVQEISLHTPMYFFLCNLSSVDIFYTTVTLPKLMDIILAEKHSISFTQCLTQMYFFLFLATTEITLLSSMAYDRYVAICKPLHYHLIMNKRKCALILGGTWISGCGNSLYVTLYVSQLSLCHSNIIQQFYCEIKAIAKIACADKGLHILIFLDTFLFGLCPFLLNLISYVKIIIIIVKIKSKSGRRKAFSTCTSHLSVLLIFYGTIVCMYMRPFSEKIDILDYVFSVLFVAVTPMLNPFIYSLNNKEVRTAIMKNIKQKVFS